MGHIHTKQFSLTEKQTQAWEVIAGDATHVMLFGGSRSGKTFLLVRAVAMRAIKAPESRHAILRFRFNHVKQSVVLDTFPKVMRLCFPDVKYTVSKTDWYATLENGSEIWFGGLDDKERAEKILGMEFVTIYLNESSQIPQSSRDIVVTRLAQQVEQRITGRPPVPLKPRMLYDCVAGDTILPGYESETIRSLAQQGNPIRVLTTRGWVTVPPPWRNGFGDLFEVVTDGGKRLKVTSSHRFWTKDGWVRCENLAIGQQLLCIDEHQFQDDAPGGLKKNQKVEDSPASCCKCRHQYDGHTPPVSTSCQAYLASSSYAKGRTQCVRHRGELDSHKVRQGQPSSQHILRTQAFRKLLFLEFFGYSLRRGFSFVLPSFLSFLKKCLSLVKLQIWCFRLQASLQSSTAGHELFASQMCSEEDSTGLSTYKRLQRCTQTLLRYLGHTCHLSTKPSVFQCPSDTPLIENCFYETVVSKKYITTDSYYTINVPIVNHYVAHGIVSHNCNPPKKSHWTYKLFVKHIDPSSGKVQDNPNDFISFKINPKDNECNLSAGYISTLEGLSAALRKRFLLGEFGDDTENGLFDETSIDKWRVVDADELPEMVRIVIAVDPSGSGDVDNADNDAIGIAACGLGVDGIGYVLADLTVKAGPATWGRIVTDAYDRYEANTVVGETNYGGEMVKFVIQAARPRTPYKAVTATRNKQVRAEPVAALYEQGKIRHVGYLTALEDELSNMTTNGYVGTGSPNRADAAVWGFTELFGEIVAERKPIERTREARRDWFC